MLSNGLDSLGQSKLELKRTLNVCHTDLPSRPRFSPFFRPCSLGPWERESHFEPLFAGRLLRSRRVTCLWARLFLVGGTVGAWQPAGRQARQVTGLAEGEVNDDRTSSLLLSSLL